jgi:peptidoglycan-associated lipoprotein
MRCHIRVERFMKAGFKLKEVLSMRGFRLKWFILVSFCSAILVMTSCTKKSVKMEEVTEPTTAASEMKTTEKPDESYGVAKRPAPEDAQRTEVQRLAKLREQEREDRYREEIRLFESEPIYFDFDKWELRPDARDILTKKAEWLRVNLAFSIRIEGHCDERGTSEYNLALGDRRANTVMKFLMALGISNERISTLSYGEEKPADPRPTEEGWALNRRAEFRLIE